CPLLVLGIWWRGLTVAGAASGLAAGVTTATGAALLSTVTRVEPGWAAILIAQPAAWTVPLAFLTMVGVSKCGKAPEWTEHALLRLHAP
ncbi:MAG: cation acetate symporter, partial [Stackebrandtia sp.]